MESKFKVGDRVRCIEKNTYAEVGEIGTVLFAGSNYMVAVCWDNDVGGHDLGTRGCPVCEHGHGEWVDDTNIEHYEQSTDCFRERIGGTIMKSLSWAEKQFYIKSEIYHRVKASIENDLRAGNVSSESLSLLAEVMEDVEDDFDSAKSRVEEQKCGDAS